jgi:hypothetical protein
MAVPCCHAELHRQLAGRTPGALLFADFGAEKRLQPPGADPSWPGAHTTPLNATRLPLSPPLRYILPGRDRSYPRPTGSRPPWAPVLRHGILKQARPTCTALRVKRSHTHPHTRRRVCDMRRLSLPGELRQSQINHNHKSQSQINHNHQRLVTRRSSRRGRWTWSPTACAPRCCGARGSRATAATLHTSACLHVPNAVPPQQSGYPVKQHSNILDCRSLFPDGLPAGWRATARTLWSLCRPSTRRATCCSEPRF